MFFLYLNLPTTPRRNDHYPYICLYDLKVAWNYNAVNNDNRTKDASIRIVDDSIIVSGKDAKADIYINPNNPNNTTWGDSWGINQSYQENICNKKYTDNYVTVFERDGIKFFVFKNEINKDPVNTYRKITLFDEPYYIKDDATYYTKVFNNAKNHNNYIIVDETGNMLTKPITSPNVIDEKNKTFSDYWSVYTREPKDLEEIPRDKGQFLNGRYVGLSQSRLDKDYRIPDLERVYEKDKCFNLSAESMYSYFFIDELWRVNYIYLNVDEFEHKVNREASENWKCDDMFYTTKRAKWID